MNSMLILVEVSNFRCRSAIGWYPEEREVKTDILISVIIKYKVIEINDNLQNVIDYQEINDILYSLTKREFKLLETMAEDIIKVTFDNFKSFAIHEIGVEIIKPQIFHKTSDTESHRVYLSKTF